MPCSQQVWKVNSKSPSVGSDEFSTIFYMYFLHSLVPIYSKYILSGTRLKEILSKQTIIGITIKTTILNFKQIDMPHTVKKTISLSICLPLLLITGSIFKQENKPQTFTVKNFLQHSEML